MNSAAEWGIIAYHVVTTAIERHGEEYVKDLAAKDPHYLDYRRGMN